jgi:hypothetical protein
VARFRFPLQPALDAAFAHERKMRAALAAAAAALADASTALNGAVRLERALRSSSPDDLRRRTTICARAETARSAAFTAFTQAAAARRALEALRTRRYAAHVRAETLREEAELDESNAQTAARHAHSDRR